MIPDYSQLQAKSKSKARACDDGLTALLSQAISANMIITFASFTSPAHPLGVLS
jgi:hypothetical protein